MIVIEPPTTKRNRAGSADTPSSRVVAHIRTGIQDGLYRRGDRLPSERDLADLLNVARPTVGRALAALSSEGLIHSNGGRLRIVSGMPTAPGVLRNTIIVLSIKAGDVHARDAAPGWLAWVDQGIIEATLRNEKHYLLFHPSMLASKEWTNLLSARPLGIVATDQGSNLKDALPHLAEAVQSGVPVAIHGNDDDTPIADRVYSDHFTGGYQLVKYLRDAGRRRILVMHPPEPYPRWYEDRLAGYEAAASEFGLDPLQFAPITDGQGLSIEAQIEVGKRLLVGYLFEHLHSAHPVDAILVVTDGDLTRLEAACRMLGKTPGTDVLIGGYDNYWAEQNVRTHASNRPFVTVDKRNRQIGAELVELLLARASGKLPAEPQHRLIKPVLIVPN